MSVNKRTEVDPDSGKAGIVKRVMVELVSQNEGMVTHNAKAVVTGKGDVVLIAVENTPPKKAYMVGDGEKLGDEVFTTERKRVKISANTEA